MAFSLLYTGGKGLIKIMSVQIKMREKEGCYKMRAKQRPHVPSFIILSEIKQAQSFTLGFLPEAIYCEIVLELER